MTICDLISNKFICFCRCWFEDNDNIMEILFFFLIFKWIVVILLWSHCCCFFGRDLEQMLTHCALSREITRLHDTKQSDREWLPLQFITYYSRKWNELALLMLILAAVVAFNMAIRWKWDEETTLWFEIILKPFRSTICEQ